MLDKLSCFVVVFKRISFYGGTYQSVKHIRIYHECEGKIEKSVPRIAVWHHKARRVMTNSDPEGQIFLSGVQEIWIQIRLDLLSRLTWVQTVCKHYQQRTKVAASKE